MDAFTLSQKAETTPGTAMAQDDSSPQGITDLSALTITDTSNPSSEVTTTTSTTMIQDTSSIEETPKLSAMARLVFTLPDSCRKMIFKECMCLPPSNIPGIPMLPPFLAAVRPCPQLYQEILGLLYTLNDFELNMHTISAF